MGRTAQKLFEYLQDVIYNPANARLNIEELDEEYRMLGKGLVYFCMCVNETRELAKALSKGDLGVDKLPSPGNEISAPLKALHASLRHMTWQSQQVAGGDYNQRLDFMGDFAEAFNTMTRQLDARQKALEKEIRLSRQKTEALQQTHSLLTGVTANIPQQIHVVEEKTGAVLYRNNAALLANDAYLARLGQVIGRNRELLERDREVEFSHEREDGTCYYVIRSYALHWDDRDARAYVVDDISKNKEYLQKLEAHAYQDTLTNAHNRFSGMGMLEGFVADQRHFSLVFVDLDNLKYVNDNFGHSEGDYYIIRAAEALGGFSPGAAVCRLGGDEFMLLAPRVTEKAAEERMNALCTRMREDFEREGKDYHCNMSFGVVEVSSDNTLQVSEILGMADEKMYAAKRLNKRTRKVSSAPG